MRHLGDISTVSGAAVAPVDIITFGSPCQDLSVAGKQVGLGGSRSGLFREAVRIIKEMRDATNGKQPRFAVWENVPRAFSSNKGADFQTVLHELCKIIEPQAPAVAIPKAGWPPAGQFTVVGAGSIAYRTIDAQFHGVPQRRRRIILVCDFAGQCAGKLLFKPRGLPGYPAEGVCEGQATPRAVAVSADKPILCYTIDPFASNSMKSNNPHSGYHATDTARCLDTTSSSPSCNQGGNVIVIQGSMVGRADENGPNGAGLSADTCFTLTAVDRHAVVTTFRKSTRGRFKGDAPTIVETSVANTLNTFDSGESRCSEYIVVENHPQDSRVRINPDGIVQTLPGQMGTGGGNVPLVILED